MKQSVTLTQGCYCGSAEKDKTLSFKGIPYAAPPIGDLRFKAPQPLSAGSESFDADHFGPPAHMFRAVRNMAKDGLGAISTRTVCT